MINAGVRLGKAVLMVKRTGADCSSSGFSFVHKFSDLFVAKKSDFSPTQYHLKLLNSFRN